MKPIQGRIPELESMRRYPERLYISGSTALLERRRVSIVGSRRPTQYASAAAHRIASALAGYGVAVVSGGAMGIDAAAHRGAGAANTIAVLPCGIDLRYPAVNAKLLEQISAEGLLISQFEPGFRATPWSFVARNEIVVALSEVLVVAEAQKGSGSMRSVEFARKMGKKIYVLPHRIGDSDGTNALLKEGAAEVIYDIDEFTALFADGDSNREKEEFIDFCSRHPTYEEVLEKFGEHLFEAELEGRVSVVNGRVIPR